MAKEKADPCGMTNKKERQLQKEKAAAINRLLHPV
jgi:hypothetical protein